jgi:hypothetical protein
LLSRLQALHTEPAARELEKKLRIATTDEEKNNLAAQLAKLRRQGQRGIGFGKVFVS